ncbi:TPA: DNA-binding transcriptional regulator [Vibrio parahaemolyticus]|uniref:helix-turn-helix domain-containing protein n=1 Tax=Vibrio parahaemolyticus TaxID=670 RepID=UPI000934A826|nr:DNA-binding transcriptional regulator [Vibrio parahaemolyticus]EGQ8195803.1 DNA-binding transcriptional regulator [Vibrio parahaemolyticus]TPA13943.1 DNA-binding transcriptional regulator [Vibrio parahaemolyticus]TPA40127.1 DNA-binding transcriptional regulator [Vibrio parahaemolyticus]TPA53888.1 DNA-binding transcriptional regulator [Vibrio parahaemolyticus]HCE2536554.1 DNA-binding transcriptional regulator [Vibrio parahaemolyticus]
MSDILKAVHQTAKDLHESGAMEKKTMRKFDTLCLTTLHDFTPAQVKTLREKSGLSQPVFAKYLNVSDKLVKKWEQGESAPKGPALKMLVIAENKGIEAIC